MAVQHAGFHVYVAVNWIFPPKSNTSVDTVMVYVEQGSFGMPI